MATIIFLETSDIDIAIEALKIADDTKVLHVITAAVAVWVRAWDTLTMFEATVCGRS